MANNIFSNLFNNKENNKNEQKQETNEKVRYTAELSDEMMDFTTSTVGAEHFSFIHNSNRNEIKEFYSNIGSAALGALPKEYVQFLRGEGLIDEDLLREADERIANQKRNEEKIAAEARIIEDKLRRDTSSTPLNSVPLNSNVEPQIVTPKKELTPEEKIAKLEEQVSSLTDAMKTQQELIKQLMTHTNVIQTSNDDVTTYDPNVDDNNKSK